MVEIRRKEDATAIKVKEEDADQEEKKRKILMSFK